MLHLQSHQHCGQVFSPFVQTLCPLCHLAEYTGTSRLLFLTLQQLFFFKQLLHLLFTFHWSLWLFYPFATNTQYRFHITIVTAHPHSRHHIGLRDPVSESALPVSFNGLSSDCTLYHGCITQAVTWWQSQVLLLLFSLHIKLAQKPRRTSALRSHLMHISATANPTTCMPL